VSTFTHKVWRYCPQERPGRLESEDSPGLACRPESRYLPLECSRGRLASGRCLCSCCTLRLWESAHTAGRRPQGSRSSWLGRCSKCSRCFRTLSGRRECSCTAGAAVVCWSVAAQAAVGPSISLHRGLPCTALRRPPNYNSGPAFPDLCPWSV
jgi:hypothetical protein